MHKKKEITFESRRRFKSSELPTSAKADNLYPEHEAYNDIYEHDKLTSEIMAFIKYNPKSSAFAMKYDDSQIESPDDYTKYLIDNDFLTEGSYIHTERDIDTNGEELVMKVPPSKKIKANPLSENAEDWKVQSDMEKYNIYMVISKDRKFKLNTEQLRSLLELTKAYYSERPKGVGWSDGGKTKKLKRRQNKTKRHKGKTRK
jgi:hypothetical protein